MLKRIDRVIFRVPQLESALRHYHGVLGLPLVRKDAKIAVLKLLDSDAELVLHTDPDLPAEATYFLVDDVRALYAKREDLGLTFAGAPTRVARGYRATVRDAFGTVMLIIDRTTAADGDLTPEDGLMTTGALFAGVATKVAAKRDALIEIYQKIGRTADDLPYTPLFESLYRDYASRHDEPKPTRYETWRHLLNLRKGGKLPKLGESRSKPPALPGESRARLRELLADDLGKRDRLPYTERFDEIVNTFNATEQRPLSPHIIWRHVATLAK
jgi:catechol 2,3-dioxygenase-like lactoylglutathione lyase family enzyme